MVVRIPSVSSRFFTKISPYSVSSHFYLYNLSLRWFLLKVAKPQEGSYSVDFFNLQIEPNLQTLDRFVKDFWIFLAYDLLYDIYALYLS